MATAPGVRAAPHRQGRGFSTRTRVGCVIVGAVGIILLSSRSLLPAERVPAAPAQPAAKALGAAERGARARPPDEPQPRQPSAEPVAQPPLAAQTASVPAPATDPGPPRGSGFRTCPGGCSGVGTCDEVSGECACPMTRAGADCGVATMPACEAGDGHTINLSVMSTAAFWRDVPNLKSGREPPTRWLGALPCACVAQALATLAGVHSGAFDTWWGQSTDMLYLVRVPCIATPRHANVADVARDGARGARWAAAGVFSWDFKLANNPYMLLPPLRESAVWHPSRWNASAPVITDVDQLPRQLPHDVVFASWASELHADASRVARLSGGAAARPADAAAGSGADALVAELPEPPSGWGAPWEPVRAEECASGCHGAGWCVPRARPSQAGPVAPTAGGAPGRAADEDGAQAAARLKAGDSGERTCVCYARIGLQHDNHVARRVRYPALRVARECAREPAPRGSAAAEEAALGAGRFGADRWRRWRWDEHGGMPASELPACPNRCSGVGRCEYGFCACPPGRWGMDCAHSREGVAAERAALARGGAAGAPRALRPRIFVYNAPPVTRRTCVPWILPELVGDALLRSAHSTALPETADYFWVYGCPLPGSMVVHALSWMRGAAPFWNRSAVAAAGKASHLLLAASEHGWAESWQAVWFGRAAHLSPAYLRPNSTWWRQLAPDSPDRMIGALELEGAADTIFKREFPPCHLCFQRAKDVMVPAFRRVNDYPTPQECERLADGLSPWSPRAPAEPDFESRRRTLVFFAGAIHTRKDVQPSRFEPWRRWRNESGYRLLQTERHPFVVDPADGYHEQVDLYAELRSARFCMVPMGKTGNYGQRMLPAVFAGCIPLITKAAGSAQLMEESLPWPRFSLHVPHERVDELGAAVARLDRAARDAMQRELRCAWRRLLWTRLYGPCIGGERLEDGEPDAFDTLMDALRRRTLRLPPATSACDLGS